ncbi:hypothetical protein BDP27DRAFT_1379955 [Rhodocollybia butyracea]|uniref:IMD domain-containing protein n=1 Tax=Rhodocollybia butyracea TaxID=206335 RepID=A0A9P5UEN7_9AGAR|nr:hypothetical protein BDP27DRAFT_1379955 [Rhodocollybia butyracea]
MAPTRPRSLRALAFNRRNSSPTPRSPSPTFSDTTNISQMNFGADGPSKIITRADLKASLQAYEQLMDSCASYRAALITMSKATAEFADAMETCSGLKGPSYEAGTRMQASSGLHHLIGNHYHVLAETLDRNFEKPLRQHLDTYRAIVTERSSSYERALREKSEVIRQTEKQNMNRKERNLQSFREALIVLQRQVDELDELKACHYAEIVEHEEEVWDVVQAKTCIVVRSTLDVYDKFTSKASDPVIEPMLQSVPDPFDSYGPPQSEDQIFSILPPLSIMPTVPSASTTPLTRTPEMENIQGLPASTSSSSSTSWSHNPNTVSFPTESSEWADVPSSPVSTSSTPRSTSPTNPIRRHSVPVGSRKSESKLRSVLSVIDEKEDDLYSHSVPQLNNSNVNASLIQPQPQKRPSGFSWTLPFSYGQSPYDEEGTNGDTTPRNSTFVSSSQTLTASATEDKTTTGVTTNVPIPS